MTKKNKIPVILITGYLGSGKTTLLNEILKNERRKVALVVNDMGSVNIDSSLLKKTGTKIEQAEMFELQNGCICCTLRNEFIQKMEEISKDNNSEVVFVEASGISDPGSIAASFLGYEEDNPKTNVYLSSIITVVDADRIYNEFIDELEQIDSSSASTTGTTSSPEDSDIATLIIDQIEFCNKIILNKCDLLNEQQLERVLSVIRNFQTKAEIIKATKCKVDLDLLITKNKFNYEQVESSSAIQRAMNSLDEDPSACYEEFGIKTYLFEDKRPLNREKFISFLNNLNTENIIRAKGYIWFFDSDKDVQLFELAGRNSSITEIAYWVAALEDEQISEVLKDDPQLKENWDKEFGDRINQIVFIGKNIDESLMKQQLLECLN
jgi:G3E family GTPase